MVAIFSRTALRTQESHDAWLFVFAAVTDAPSDARRAPCPNCGFFAVRFQFVADASSRIGFCALWCGNCDHGHVLSRVRVPSSIDFLSLDADDDVLQAAIPEFRDAVSVDLGPADLAPDPTPAPLSPREAEVLELMREGLGVQAIAERLIISRATVYTLRQRISLKLGRPITELAVR